MKTALAILTALAITASFVANSAFATVQNAYYEDSPPASLQISSSTAPYGFMTHSFAGPSSDDTFDSRSSARWGSSITSKSYLINMAGSQPAAGFTQSDLRAQIVNAGNNWYSTLSSSSSVLQFTDGGSTANKPSAFATTCGTGTDNWNGVVEIGFCNTPGFAGQVKINSVMSNGNTVTISEADMLFDSGRTWRPTGTGSGPSVMFNTALHEFGHFHFLGDLYAQHTGLSCPGEGSPLPIMCTTDSASLQWGDKDGIRWLYPKVNSFALSPSGAVSGTDSAVAQIDSSSNSNPDLLYVWGDYNSATGQTAIKAKVIWDLSSTSGSGTTGTTVTLTTINGQALDVGATLYDVGSISTQRDLIVTYTASISGGQRFAYYTVFWDLTRSLNSFTFGSTSGPYSILNSADDQGTDAVVFDMNGDGVRDLVLMDTYNLSGSLKLYYYYGTLSTSGTVSSWTTGSSSGVHGVNTEDSVGISIPYPSSRIATVSYRSDLGGYMREHLFHFSTAGAIDADIKYKFAPLKTTGTPTGIGGGDAFNLGEQPYNEQFFSWADTSTGYYTVEWDSRLNSHG
ncbi:MAG: hypothetical protein AB1753_08860 [Thermoproteota archaeon]